MAADSPAEKNLKKLLLHNKLITEPQWERVVKNTVGKSEKTLPQELLDRRFVPPDLMKKIVAAIKKKGLSFPILKDDMSAEQEGKEIVEATETKENAEGV